MKSSIRYVLAFIALFIVCSSNAQPDVKGTWISKGLDTETQIKLNLDPENESLQLFENGQRVERFELFSFVEERSPYYLLHFLGVINKRETADGAVEAYRQKYPVIFNIVMDGERIKEIIMEYDFSDLERIEMIWFDEDGKIELTEKARTLVRG